LPFQPRRPVHRRAIDPPGQTPRNSRYPAASPDLLLPVATALADIPALALTEAEASGLRHGQAISLVTLMGRIPGNAEPSCGLVRAMAGSRVVGLARLQDGWMKPERLL
jgi:tRNA pseudouridine55 synthase